MLLFYSFFEARKEQYKITDRIQIKNRKKTDAANKILIGI